MALGPRPMAQWANPWKIPALRALHRLEPPACRLSSSRLSTVAFRRLGVRLGHADAERGDRLAGVRCHAASHRSRVRGFGPIRSGHLAQSGRWTNGRPLRPARDLEALPAGPMRLLALAV